MEAGVQEGTRAARKPAPAWVAALALAAIDACLLIVAIYALLRAYDVFFKSEPNPATIVWSAHIAMFWRLGVGVYVAIPIAAMCFMGARHDLALATRITGALAPVVGALIALQGALLP